MKQFFFFSYFGILISLFGCKESTNSYSPEANVSQVFPVKSFFESQLNLIEITPYFIVKYESCNTNSMDSNAIKFDSLNYYAKDFLEAPIPDSSQINESTFLDESTGLINISYLPVGENSDFIRMDITIRQDPVKDKVNSIYIEWVKKENEIPQLKKMFWKANHFFQISTLDIESLERIKSIKIVWDDSIQ